MTERSLSPSLLFLLLSVITVFGLSCSVEAKKIEPATDPNSATVADAKNAGTSRGATIDIEPNSPADTVRAFYERLREKKFREAIFLTNLRPAVEGLTDTELKEFQVDFEAIAADVPAQLEINGEIITGDQASVTAKFPGDGSDKPEIQELKLRREGDVWVILTVDEAVEKKIKQEGKNYFYALRIETHQEEAKKMLDRISKAQMVYALQNGSLYGEISQLIAAGFLPDDVLTSDSTGYNYSVKLSTDRKDYSTTATPAVYGKTGKLTFLVKLDAKRTARLTSKDEGTGKTK